MKLRSFGCSFIFGTDLHDDGRDLPVPTFSKVSWPAQLAKKLGLEYDCLARPGAGNLQILETLINNQSPDIDLYVIGWTWIDRYDYIDQSLRKPWPGMTKWGTVMPVDETERAKFYYKHFHSEYQDKLQNLIYIKTAIDLLRDNGCRFIMTYMDDLLFCRRWHTSDIIFALQDSVKPYLGNFQSQDFLSWSQVLGYNISDTMHPLEQAHSAAADLVYADLQQRIKF